MPAFHVPKALVPQNARQSRIRDPFFVVPPTETFAGLFNVTNQTEYVYFGQSLRDSQENALAMRRDGFVHELLRHRQTPVVCLPYHVVVDDVDDPRQKSIAEVLDKIVRDIPKLKYIMITLMESLFYGKYGVQTRIGPRKVMGNVFNSIIDHTPVNGDKIRYKWDGTPGIAIRTGADQDYSQTEAEFLNAYSGCISSSMLGMAIWLKDPFLRDRFLIHNFEPFDVDYLFEIDQQLSKRGLGLRDRLYWVWNLRVEVLSWLTNALQRVGANGMIYGAYEEGNYAMQQDVLNAIRMLAQDNYAAFPVKGGAAGLASAKGLLERIEPSAVGYDILLQLIEWCEGIMRRAFLGQDLSSVAKPTGIGAGAAQLQGDVRMDFIEYDAGILAETLTEQLLKVILKYNKFIYDGHEMFGDELPFSCRLEFQLSREDVQESMAAAESLFRMGVSMDKDDLRRRGGFSPPRNRQNEVSNPQIQQQSQQAKSDKETRRMMDHAQKAVKHAARLGGKSSFRPSGNGHARRRHEFAGVR